MLRFISRWFKGLIAGWILGLFLFVLKRILSRAFGNINLETMTQDSPARKPADDPSVVETLWAGMTAAQLQQTFGRPDLKQKTGPNSEVWTYTTLGGRTTPTAVTVQDGTVKEWENLLL